MPETPLSRFKSLVPCLKTAHHPFFVMKDGVDRSAAHNFRIKVRNQEHKGVTSGCVPGFVQANFVALRKKDAYDFLMFCLRNPKPCPLLAVTDPGSGNPGVIAPSSDVRTDIPKYKVFRNGKVSEYLDDISHLWTEDMVGFLLGCSFSWEAVLEKQNLAPKNVREGKNVSMYKTSIPNVKSGPFQGKLVVSMRPYDPSCLKKIEDITEAYPGAHGGPVHWGDPSAIGVHEVAAPDFGDPVQIAENEVPVFWACGVTPQVALDEAGLDLAITHAPGHMFVTDITDTELESPKA